MTITIITANLIRINKRTYQSNNLHKLNKIMIIFDYIIKTKILIVMTSSIKIKAINSNSLV